MRPWLHAGHCPRTAHDNRWPVGRLHCVLEMWRLFQERYLDVAANRTPGELACQLLGGLAGRVKARTVGKKDDRERLRRKAAFARQMRGAIGQQLRQTRIETEGGVPSRYAASKGSIELEAPRGVECTCIHDSYISKNRKCVEAAHNTREAFQLRINRRY